MAHTQSLLLSSSHLSSQGSSALDNGSGTSLHPLVSIANVLSFRNFAYRSFRRRDGRRPDSSLTTISPATVDNSCILLQSGKSPRCLLERELLHSLPFHRIHGDAKILR